MTPWIIDGQINLAALDKLEFDLKAITDKTGGIMDLVEGKGFVPAFQCSHSQLLYPADYAKQWGVLYGIGLGPDICSEALDSDYRTDPPQVTSSVRRITDIMHGLITTKAQLDFVMVTPARWEARTTVLALGDDDLEQRAPILLAKQLERSPTLKTLYAEWERRNGKVDLSRMGR